jgi:hypothetical protein
MKLQDIIKTNKMILALIASKYPDISFTIHDSIESRYYVKLLEETKTAQSALNHGGLAEIKRG